MTSSSDKGRKARATVADDLDELSGLIWETLHGLKRAGEAPAQLHEAAIRGSLGPRHAPPLLAVAAAEPLSVSELARRLGLGLSTTSTLVGQLSRAGLVQREEDETDRRRTIVRLDDDHRAAITSWRAESLAPLRATLEALPQDARAGFMAGWRLLHEELTRATVEQPA